jgi:Uma2 family endonuclease
MIRMAIPQEERKYSYADYLVWDAGERIEIINGDIYVMTPAPSRKHQQVLRELSTEFTLFLRDKDCEVFFAPFDVRLHSGDKQDNEVYNIVQPDLTVVCDKTKLDEKGCKGTPDMVIEILSPASVKLDRWKKYQLYEKVGVKEYWIVDAINESIEVYLLNGQIYEFHGVFTKEDTIQVRTLKGLELKIKQIFEN